LGLTGGREKERRERDTTGVEPFDLRAPRHWAMEGCVIKSRGDGILDVERHVHLLEDLGFRVEDLQFRVSGLGIRV